MSQRSEKLTDFKLGESPVPVSFVETQTVKEGVECDTYTFVGDNSRDLAIVRVSGGCKTPLQRVSKGTKTSEGFFSGEGSLTVCSAEGKAKTYSFPSDNTPNPVEVEVDQTMQWHADANTGLVFYEICEPPYEDGRFENLAE